jgi:hypothetical protein
VVTQNSNAELKTELKTNLSQFLAVAFPTHHMYGNGYTAMIRPEIFSWKRGAPREYKVGIKEQQPLRDTSCLSYSDNSCEYSMTFI